MSDQLFQWAQKPPAGSSADRLESSRPDSSAAVGFLPVSGLLTDGGPRPLDTLRRSVERGDPLGGTAVGGSVVEALRRHRGRGRGLAGSIAEAMGVQLGIETSNLRLHADAESGAIARSVQAAAFTHGDDIYFAPGVYQPSSESGQRVIAHELSHVAAQRAGTDNAGGSGLTVGRANDPAEAAADRSADRVLAALRRTTVTAASDQRRSPGIGSVVPELRRSSARRSGVSAAADGAGGLLSPEARNAISAVHAEWSPLSDPASMGTELPFGATMSVARDQVAFDTGSLQGTTSQTSVPSHAVTPSVVRRVITPRTRLEDIVHWSAYTQDLCDRANSLLSNVNDVVLESVKAAVARYPDETKELSGWRDSRGNDLREAQKVFDNARIKSTRWMNVATENPDWSIQEKAAEFVQEAKIEAEAQLRVFSKQATALGERFFDAGDIAYAHRVLLMADVAEAAAGRGRKLIDIDRSQPKKGMLPDGAALWGAADAGGNTMAGSVVANVTTGVGFAGGNLATVGVAGAYATGPVAIFFGVIDAGLSIRAGVSSIKKARKLAKLQPNLASAEAAQLNAMATKRKKHKAKNEVVSGGNAAMAVVGGTLAVAAASAASMGIAAAVVGGVAAVLGVSYLGYRAYRGSDTVQLSKWENFATGILDLARSPGTNKHKTLARQQLDALEFPNYADKTLADEYVVTAKMVAEKLQSYGTTYKQESARGLLQLLVNGSPSARTDAKNILKVLGLDVAKLDSLAAAGNGAKAQEKIAEKLSTH